MKNSLYSIMQRDFVISFCIIWFGLILNDLLSPHFPGESSFVAVIFMLLCLASALYVPPLQKYIFKPSISIKEIRVKLYFLLFINFLAFILLWQSVYFHQKTSESHLLENRELFTPSEREPPAEPGPGERRPLIPKHGPYLEL